MEHNEDAVLAADRTIKLWCVPLLTTGAVHGQYYQYLQEVMPNAGDPARDKLDQQYELGWSCPSFRTYAFMSAAVAVINAAGTSARHAADTVSRHYDVPGPSHLHHNWHSTRPQPSEYDFESTLAPYDADAAAADMEQLLSDDRGEPTEQSPTATHDAIFVVSGPTTTITSEASAATPNA